MPFPCKPDASRKKQKTNKQKTFYYNEKVLSQFTKCDGGIKQLRQVSDHIGVKKGVSQDQEA